MNINRDHWGWVCAREVFLFELKRGGMRACVSNYGGVLQALYVHNARGEELDVVLGYDTLAEYQNSETFFGAMVGPIADRVRGGCCTLDGRVIHLPQNAGPDTMHSGPGGFHGKVWNWEPLPDGICFCLKLTEDETGFPGMLDVKLAYRILENDVLRIEYNACCDRETAASFTNHSYFNLDGCERNCREQIITVHASRYAETERESNPVCTGRALAVDGTPLDLRNGCRLAEVLDATDFREIRTGGGLDHYFLVDGAGMREHARVESENSGICLVCRSNAPGVLVYTGNGLEVEQGKKGKIYEKNWGICLETEGFPNGVNLPNWRNQVLLDANRRFESATEFAFFVKSTR